MLAGCHCPQTKLFNSFNENSLTLSPLFDTFENLLQQLWNKSTIYHDFHQENIMTNKKTIMTENFIIAADKMSYNNHHHFLRVFIAFNQPMAVLIKIFLRI